MIRRAARDIEAGMVVNLGIGLPGGIPRFLAAESGVILHSENGIAGVGPVAAEGAEDRNLIDAGGLYVTAAPGASFFDSSVSFALVRGGRIDLTFLGAFQVAVNGDLANWMIPGRHAPGVGGGMELAQKARRVVAMTRHVDKSGQPKIVKECSLPLTARGCVDRIISDMAVIDIIDGEATLVEIAHSSSVAEIIEATGAQLRIGNGDLPTF